MGKKYLKGFDSRKYLVAALYSFWDLSVNWLVWSTILYNLRNSVILEQSLKWYYIIYIYTYNNTLSNKNDENKPNVSLSVKIPWIPNIGFVPSWYSNVTNSLFFSFSLLLLLLLLLFSFDVVDRWIELVLLANRELSMFIVISELGNE